MFCDDDEFFFYHAFRKSSYSSPDTSHIFCKYFARGSCKFGNDCYFSHDITDKKPCKNYLRDGSCSFGDNCWYRHIGAEQVSKEKEEKEEKRKRELEEMKEHNARLLKEQIAERERLRSIQPFEFREPKPKSKLTLEEALSKLEVIKNEVADQLKEEEREKEERKRKKERGELEENIEDVEWKDFCEFDEICHNFRKFVNQYDLTDWSVDDHIKLISAFNISDQTECQEYYHPLTFVMGPLFRLWRPSPQAWARLCLAIVDLLKEWVDMEEVIQAWNAALDDCEIEDENYEPDSEESESDEDFTEDEENEEMVKLEIEDLSAAANLTLEEVIQSLPHDIVEPHIMDPDQEDEDSWFTALTEVEYKENDSEDLDYEPEESEGDDEETIAQEEAEADEAAVKEELQDLEAMAQMSKEELLSSLPPEVLQPPDAESEDDEEEEEEEDEDEGVAGDMAEDEDQEEEEEVDDGIGEEEEEEYWAVALATDRELYDEDDLEDKDYEPAEEEGTTDEDSTSAETDEESLRRELKELEEMAEIPFEEFVSSLPPEILRNYGIEMEDIPIPASSSPDTDTNNNDEGIKKEAEETQEDDAQNSEKKDEEKIFEDNKHEQTIPDNDTDKDEEKIFEDDKHEQTIPDNETEETEPEKPGSENEAEQSKLEVSLDVPEPRRKSAPLLAMLMAKKYTDAEVFIGGLLAGLLQLNHPDWGIKEVAHLFQKLEEGGYNCIDRARALLGMSMYLSVDEMAQFVNEYVKLTYGIRDPYECRCKTPECTCEMEVDWEYSTDVFKELADLAGWDRENKILFFQKASYQLWHTDCLSSALEKYGLLDRSRGDMDEEAVRAILKGCTPLPYTVEYILKYYGDEPGLVQELMKHIPESEAKPKSSENTGSHCAGRSGNCKNSAKKMCENGMCSKCCRHSKRMCEIHGHNLGFEDGVGHSDIPNHHRYVSVKPFLHILSNADWGEALQKKGEQGYRNIKFGPDVDLKDHHIELLASKCPKLEVLEMGSSDTGSGARVSDRAIKCLTDRCPKLRKLKLESFTSISDEPLQRLFKMCSNLECFEISGNDKVCGRLTEKLVKQLFNKKLLPKLRFLSLQDQLNITPDVIFRLRRCRTNVKIIHSQ
ncbi:uncharacterized protein LOC106179496 isoform X2 [Lingula anatina]|uniref:RING-type E3 ubiquitin transferase n=1 Tax=Lingula anatina TaxID=7574 RepID=A0A1S3K844_LINAN|nr:uncharacterized protein LOC106179496 isoform X2 [Lingula anatina]|eukprot:XP_013418609.1 uncharacterized protein LOC106179496 isoform X2 [Lingula anatina]